LRNKDFDVDNKNNLKDKNPEGIGSFSQYIGLGIELPLSIAIGIFSGMWVGSCFGHKNAGALVGLFLGLGAAILSFVRVIRIWNKEKD